jgi:hypothetical protein
MISTPILALAPLFGAILGQGLSPLIVNDDPGQVPFLNIYSTVLVVIGTITCWLFLHREAPPTPPSRSAALLQDQPPLTLKEIFQDAKKVKYFDNLILCQGCQGLMAVGLSFHISYLNLLYSFYTKYNIYL